MEDCVEKGVTHATQDSPDHGGGSTRFGRAHHSAQRTASEHHDRRHAETGVNGMTGSYIDAFGE
jgi:hypothetical protein